MDAPYAIIKYWHPTTSKLPKYPPDTPISKEDFLAVIEDIVDSSYLHIMIAKKNRDTLIIWLDHRLFTQR